MAEAIAQSRIGQFLRGPLDAVVAVACRHQDRLGVALLSKCIRGAISEVVVGVADRVPLADGLGQERDIAVSAFLIVGSCRWELPTVNHKTTDSGYALRSRIKLPSVAEQRGEQGPEMVGRPERTSCKRKQTARLRLRRWCLFRRRIGSRSNRARHAQLPA